MPKLSLRRAVDGRDGCPPRRREGIAAVGGWASSRPTRVEVSRLVENRRVCIVNLTHESSGRARKRYPAHFGRLRQPSLPSVVKRQSRDFVRLGAPSERGRICVHLRKSADDVLIPHWAVSRSCSAVSLPAASTYPVRLARLSPYQSPAPSQSASATIKITITITRVAS